MNALRGGLIAKLKSGKSAIQINAKDFLTILLEFKDRDTRNLAGPILAQWACGDFKYRYGVGNRSTSRMLIQLGNIAVPCLLKLINPDAQLLQLTKILKKISDKNEAGKLARALSKAVYKRRPGPARIEALMALKIIQARTKQAVLELNGIAADEILDIDTRRRAMQELADIGNQATLPVAMKFIRNFNEDLYIRDYSLKFIETVCDRRCSQLLKPILLSIKHKHVKIGAAIAALKIGGSAVLRKVLRALPTRDAYYPDDIKELSKWIIKNIGIKGRDSLRKSLQDRRHWPGQLIAITALGKLGTAKDIKLLQKVGLKMKKPVLWKSRGSITSMIKRSIRYINRARK